MGLYDREYYRDEDDGPGFHWRLPRSIVMTLIVINVAIYLVDALADHALALGLAVTPRTVSQPWMWWKFLTYGFAHAQQPQHLLFNMLGLWFFGRTVEEVLGRREFLWFYLTAIVASGLPWAVRESLAHPQFATPLIGASGAVTAVILLFVFRFPRQQVLLMAFIPAPAWVLGVLLVVGNLFGSPTPGPDGARIAYDVHLAGAAFATIYFWGGLRLGDWAPSFAWWSRLSRRAGNLRTGKPALRIHQPDDAEPFHKLDEQADQILAKLHTHGDGSLTPQERRILEDYSRRMRQKHR